MINFLHKLFNPHCLHCTEEARANRVCNTCEVLQLQLELMRAERDILLGKLLDPKIVSEPESKIEDLQPIKKTLPWKARQQILEAEDRATAQLRNNQTKSTEELETEVLEGVKQNG